MTHDLIVIGAGPAGGNAALAAAEAGLSVVLLDEQPAPGGQVWRAPVPGTDGNEGTPDRREGDGLRAALAASVVEVRTARRAWSVGGNFRVDAVGPEGNEWVEAPRLVAATGAYERVVPFPGWTLPGVIGLAGATVLLKSHGMVPAGPVVVAGCGPLLAAVAAGIVKAGGTVAAVVDLAGAGDWLAAAPRLLSRPDQMATGLGWVARIAGRRVPVLFRHTVRRADGTDRVAGVTVGPVDGAGAPIAGAERTFEAATLVVGHGLIPGAEIPRLFRAAQRYDRTLGGHVPVLDPDGRTSVPGLYAAGDGVGVRGAAAAVEAGRLAGLAVALDAGRIGADLWSERATPARFRLDRLGPFSTAMARMMAARAGQIAAVPAGTVVCRCEDVTRAEIEAAVTAGAREMNQLKHFTRCGMGPCQGRMCGDAVAELLALTLGRDRSAVVPWTGRPPLRPVPLGDLVGRFDYSDIPIPRPAPL